MGSNRANATVVESSLVIIALISVLYVMSNAARFMIPFAFAFLLSMLLFPIIRFGTRHNIPAMPMVITIMASLIAVLFPLGIFLNSRIQGMVDILPGYYMKLVDIGQTILKRFDLPIDFWESVNWYNTIGRYVSGMTGFLISWLSTLAMTLVFLVFMLLESPSAEDRLRGAFHGESGEKIVKIAGKIVAQISKYLRTLAVISFATGCCVWGVLSMIGVDFSLAWGVLAFFLNFIPTLGSIAASIPPILVAIVQFYPNWVPVVITAVSLLVIQFTIGNIMTPKIMGDALDLSPVVILISLMCWGLIWGFAGALLSVPIAVMIKIICENVEQLNFIAKMICSTNHKASSKV